MAYIPESEILDLMRSRVEGEAVVSLFEAALEGAGIARKPLYSPEEVVRIGAAITEASYSLLEEALTEQGFIKPGEPTAP